MGDGVRVTADLFDFAIRQSLGFLTQEFTTPGDHFRVEYVVVYSVHEAAPHPADNRHMNRTGLVGGSIQREDGTHGTTQQAFPGGA